MSRHTLGGMSDLTIPEYDIPPHHWLCPQFDNESMDTGEDCICGVMKILRDLADEVMAIAISGIATRSLRAPLHTRITTSERRTT